MGAQEKHRWRLGKATANFPAAIEAAGADHDA